MVTMATTPHEFSETMRVVMARTHENAGHIAEILGNTRGSISHRLNGRVRWNVEEVLLLADHWGIAPSDLFRGPGAAVQALDDARARTAGAISAA